MAVNVSPHLQQTQQDNVTFAPVPVVVTNKNTKYKSVLYGLGFSEVLLGSITCVSCIICLFVAGTGYKRKSGNEITFISIGLPTGIFPIVSGVLGICTKGKSTRCMYNANMIMTIISAVMMSILFSTTIVSATSTSNDTKELVAMYSLVSITSLATLVIAIIHSAYCCAGTGYDIKPNQGRIVQPTTQQLHQRTDGQCMAAKNQPLMQQAKQPLRINQPLSGMITGVTTTSLTAMPSQTVYMQPVTPNMVGRDLPGLIQPTSFNQVQQMHTTVGALTD